VAVDRPFPSGAVRGAVPHAQEARVVERTGGEVRVEVRFVADWQLDRTVRVWEMNFYEGTSEETTDLDGHLDHATDLPRDSWQSFRSAIHSPGSGSVDMNVVLANNVKRTELMARG
jgi:hypothetical protein